MKGVMLGGEVYNSVTRKFENNNLFYEDGVITEISCRKAEISDGDIYDATGLLVSPGYVDIHTHGAKKFAFDDIYYLSDTEIHTLIDHYLSHGVTSLYPTSTTMGMDSLIKCITRLNEIYETFPIRVPGFHVEGPYISFKRRGAHNADLLKNPDTQELELMLKAAGGKFKLRITLAPELEGAMEFIRTATKRGVKITLGHTDADSVLMKEAIAAGADCATHLYNAMSPLSHREPGAVGACLGSRDCYTEMICDGFHIVPDVVKLTYSLKASQEKFVVITDSLSCAGVDEDFSFESAGLTVYYKDGRALLADGTVAGSALNMHDGTKNLSEFACIPMHDAIYFSTATPAKACGIFDKVGSLEVGKFADFCVYDKAFNIKNVFVNGLKRI